VVVIDVATGRIKAGSPSERASTMVATSTIGNVIADGVSAAAIGSTTDAAAQCGFARLMCYVGWFAQIGLWLGIFTGQAKSMANAGVIPVRCPRAGISSR
jgi:hypothetical protein